MKAQLTGTFVLFSALVLFGCDGGENNYWKDPEIKVNILSANMASRSAPVASILSRIPVAGNVLKSEKTNSSGADFEIVDDGDTTDYPTGTIVSGEEYPFISVAVFFYQEGNTDGCCGGGYSDYYSPDTHMLAASEFGDDRGKGRIVSFMGFCRSVDEYIFEDPAKPIDSYKIKEHKVVDINTLADTYDVYVSYHYTDPTAIDNNNPTGKAHLCSNDKKTYKISRDTILAMFNKVGIKKCEVLHYTSLYDAVYGDKTTETWGDYGYYEYTDDQEKQIVCNIKFDVILPKEFNHPNAPAE